ncbi:hypothetical protein AB838_06190 [Rhodobacteraceae bacterium (ex Bugula neritina AB1)]|nr:hypothetical protein AB838_06190 [Rhodobacteraceae bacterium (ex Bugula neritina AB1)]
MELTTMKLICVPFAGAGASFYHGWAHAGFSAFKLSPVMLPGRERLIAEPPFTCLQKAAGELAGNILAEVGGAGDEALIVFGHCFLGSVLAYEITHRLIAAKPGLVRHLVVSASRVPEISRQLGTGSMSDDAFLELVKSTTGYTHEAMDIPEMRELLLPPLRADFIMDETYVSSGVRKLPVPITAIAADQDALVAREEVMAWSDYTSSSFTLKDVRGGHMYLASDPSELFAILAEIGAEAGEARYAAV